MLGKEQNLASSLIGIGSLLLWMRDTRPTEMFIFLYSLYWFYGIFDSELMVIMYALILVFWSDENAIMML